MNSFIDSHAHIYLDDFKDKIENVIDNSINHNIDKILMPNINLKTVNSMKNLSLKYGGKCFCMLGLHPCYVGDDY
jgi:TatD DNase family protein